MNEGHKDYDKEYVRVGNLLIDKIKSSRFTQTFWGYDTGEVDDYLDDLIKLIKHHRPYENISLDIETQSIAQAEFKMSFRGYDRKEMRRFIESIAYELKKINKIKAKYIQP